MIAIMYGGGIRVAGQPRRGQHRLNHPHSFSRNRDQRYRAGDDDIFSIIGGQEIKSRRAVSLAKATSCAQDFSLVAAGK